MTYTIRRCRLDDVRRLDAVIFPDVPAEPLGYWWAAYSPEGDPVGFAGAYVWNADEQEERAFVLSRCGVLTGHRGHGLQRRLIRARVREARLAETPEVWTYTAHYNTQSANNLIREGFTLWKPRRWGGSARPLAIVEDTAWLYWRRKL